MLSTIGIIRGGLESVNGLPNGSYPHATDYANMVNQAGITDRLINLARATVGYLPCGLWHINVAVSMLFAGISGSSTADAEGIGSLF